MGLEWQFWGMVHGQQQKPNLFQSVMRFDAKSARSNEAANECEKKTGDNENSTQRSSQHPFISIVETALLRRPKSALVETFPLTATQR